MSVEPRGLEVAADWRTLGSPETYTGYGQSTGSRTRTPRRSTGREDYAARRICRSTPGRWRGQWTVARHAAVSDEAGARIAFQFHARDVNLVMGPVVKGTSIPFRVFLDGRPPERPTGLTWRATAAGR